MLLEMLFALFPRWGKKNVSARARDTGRGRGKKRIRVLREKFAKYFVYLSFTRPFIGGRDIKNLGSCQLLALEKKLKRRMYVYVLLIVGFCFLPIVGWLPVIFMSLVAWPVSFRYLYLRAQLAREGEDGWFPVREILRAIHRVSAKGCVVRLPLVQFFSRKSKSA